MELPIPRTAVAALLLMLASVSAPAIAAPGDQVEMMFALHLVPWAGLDSACETAPQGGFGCEGNYQEDPTVGSNLVCSAGLDQGYTLYLVLLNIDVTAGVAGVTFGIDYPLPEGDPPTGGFVVEGVSCAGAESPDANWPGSPPAGNVLTWDPGVDCQRTLDPSDPDGEGYAIAYAFYVYPHSAGNFWVVEHPGLDILEVADCEGGLSYPPYPECAAGAVFGLGPGLGYDPCLGGCEELVVPVRETTWGRIKRTFGGDR